MQQMWIQIFFYNLLVKRFVFLNMFLFIYLFLVKMTYNVHVNYYVLLLYKYLISCKIDFGNDEKINKTASVL